jgi:tetratricopeptide (TPR) repeat protein
VERFSGNYAAALDAFSRAEKLALSLGNDAARAYALCGAAGCLRVMGRGAESLRKYRRAGEIFRRERDAFGRAYSLCGQANALRVYGDPRRTIALYRRSAALYKKLGDTSSTAFALWGMGGSLRRLARFAESLDCYRRARRGFTRSGDDRGLILTDLGEARLWRDRRRDARVPPLLRRAVSLARRKKLPYETALAGWEGERFHKTSGPALDRLGFLGIPRRVPPLWRDVP